MGIDNCEGLGIFEDCARETCATDKLRRAARISKAVSKLSAKHIPAHATLMGGLAVANVEETATLGPRHKKYE